jgi:protein Hikeshi
MRSRYRRRQTSSVSSASHRVGENLFNFMQSFYGADGGKLIVPTDILDQWFRKFQERAQKDPTYLNSFDYWTSFVHNE